jgi:hypothetical protein
MEKKIVNLELFCVTNKPVEFIENSFYKLAWVGPEEAPQDYIRCDIDENIFFKEKYYSELTFQYWYWKNLLNFENKNWIGFCQKRRFWTKKNYPVKLRDQNINQIILDKPQKEWEDFESIICKPIELNQIKKIKMIKRGYKSLLKNPLPFFDKNKRTIKFHFDMHHGYGNIDKAIDVMSNKDREDFREYLNVNTSFNPHVMFISKNDIIDKWFNDLFVWLFECEKIFGFKDLYGYDTKRLYAYLAERYLSFWFKKYTKYLEWEWVFFENN